ncbi:hypothetical protein J3F83DRAFT_162428 [Trichoderma novae-zelandiae]
MLTQTCIFVVLSCRRFEFHGAGCVRNLCHSGLHGGGVPGKKIKQGQPCLRADKPWVGEFSMGERKRTKEALGSVKVRGRQISLEIQSYATCLTACLNWYLHFLSHLISHIISQATWESHISSQLSISHVMSCHIVVTCWLAYYSHPPWPRALKVRVPKIPEIEMIIGWNFRGTTKRAPPEPSGTNREADPEQTALNHQTRPTDSDRRGVSTPQIFILFIQYKRSHITTRRRPRPRICCLRSAALYPPGASHRLQLANCVAPFQLLSWTSRHYDLGMSRISSSNAQVCILHDSKPSLLSLASSV